MKNWGHYFEMQARKMKRRFFGLDNLSDTERSQFINFFCLPLFFELVGNFETLPIDWINCINNNESKKEEHKPNCRANEFCHLSGTSSSASMLWNCFFCCTKLRTNVLRLLQPNWLIWFDWVIFFSFWRGGIKANTLLYD